MLVKPFPRSGGWMVSLVLSVVITVTVGLRPVDAGVFNPETFTLSNGMDVVLIANPRVPVVTHMVWYKVGSADEPSGKSGIAHLFEHLMFKGTEKYGPGEFSRILARHGGRENAFTSADYTAYYQTIASDRLEMMMMMEADRMKNLRLTQDQLDTERLVVLEERRQRTDNNPGAILAEHVSASLFMNYPYRIPIIGWEHEIRGLVLDDLRTFYRRWYAPNNAILVVAGDVTMETLRPLAEKYYGVLEPVDGIARNRAQEPPQSARRKVVLRDSRVREPSWSRVFLAPSYQTGETRHADALEVLAAILGNGATSRLYRRLVVEQSLMNSAGAHYSPNSLGPSRFVFYASPKPGVTMEAVEAAIEAEISDVLANGVTIEEVARSKRTMRAAAVYARDSLSGGARALGAALATGRTVADVETWPDRIADVTRADVLAAARKVFSNDRSVTALLLPEDKKSSKNKGGS